MAWDLQASAGAVGKSILWRGDWSAAISYNPNDAVAYQGSSYICLEAAIGVPPPDAASSFVPALANTSSQGAIAALPASNQTSYYARGDNTWQLFQEAAPRLPRNHLAGLTVSNNVTDSANDIDIAVGECRSDDNAEDMYLTTVLTKRLDAAWVVGTNQGGLDTGTIADGQYHLFLIKNVTSGVVDALFSASYASPTMPSGYTVKRRLLSIRRNVASFGGLWKFRQLPGDYFQAKTYIQDATLGGAPASQTYSVGTLTCPIGFKVLCHLSIRVYNTGGIQSLSIFDSDTIGSLANATLWTTVANASVAGETFVWSNTAGMHTYVVGGGTGGTYSFTTVLGFYDSRGKG